MSGQPKRLLRNINAKIAAIPMIVTTLVVFVGGTVWTVVYSFTDSKLLPRLRWVGLDQYERLWSNSRWLISIENLLFYGVMSLVFTIGMGFLLAVCTGLNCDGLSRGFWNSVLITVPSVILSIVVASVNGYALVNWRFKGSDVFFTILIFGSFIPYQVMLYPIVILLREMGIYGTLWGLVLVHTIFGMPILTLLFRNYFSTIPEELFKAARVDGAGFWSIHLQIMLPMSLPIFVVALILQVTGIWNDFLFGVVYTMPDLYPMTVQLNNIVNSVQGVKEYNVNMAATLLTGLVPLVIYFLSGKLFVRGIAAGAVKG